jgi:DNA-binding response OmpR family regulator
VPQLLLVDADVETEQLVQGLSVDLDESTLLRARTAEEGIRLATEHRPDLILLSADLAGQSGLEGGS